eukprot:scaffold1475_cov111-Cylindrotheca_fusiformis.AAC.7
MPDPLSEWNTAWSVLKGIQQTRRKMGRTSVIIVLCGFGSSLIESLQALEQKAQQPRFNKELP